MVYENKLKEIINSDNTPFADIDMTQAETNSHDDYVVNINII